MWKKISKVWILAALFVFAALLAALIDLVKRRLCQKNMTVVYQPAHMAEEEGKQKYLNVRAVNVSIAHYDYFAVAELFNIKILADTAAERLNYRYKRLI